jgi:hypothetical protein
MRYFQRLILVFLLIIFSISLTSCKTTKTEIRNDPKVYITQYGTKYHSKDCFYLTQSKIAISRYKAIDNGYSACSYCKGKSSEYIQTEYIVETNSNNAGLIILIIVGSVSIIAFGIIFFKYEDKLLDIPVVGGILYLIGSLISGCFLILSIPLILISPIYEWLSNKLKRK